MGLYWYVLQSFQVHIFLSWTTTSTHRVTRSPVDAAHGLENRMLADSKTYFERISRGPVGIEDEVLLISIFPPHYLLSLPLVPSNQAVISNRHFSFLEPFRFSDSAVNHTTVAKLATRAQSAL